MVAVNTDFIRGFEMAKLTHLDRYNINITII